MPGTGTELCDYSMIIYELRELEQELIILRDEAARIKVSMNPEELLSYLDKCVVFHCKLIKVHPYPDGNGRTIRCFVNRLLEEAGLPPIYIKATERTEYHNVMNKANNEDDYTDIKQFYRYKVCDSIVELDINERLKKENNDFNSKQKK